MHCVCCVCVCRVDVVGLEVCRIACDVCMLCVCHVSLDLCLMSCVFCCCVREGLPLSNALCVCVLFGDEAFVLCRILL